MDIHNDAVKAMRYDTPEGTGAQKGSEVAAASTEALAAALAEEEDEF